MHYLQWVDFDSAFASGQGLRRTRSIFCEAHDSELRYMPMDVIRSLAEIALCNACCLAGGALPPNGTF